VEDDEVEEPIVQKPRKINFDPKVFNLEKELREQRKGKPLLVMVGVKKNVSLERFHFIIPAWKDSLSNAHVEADIMPLEEGKIMVRLKRGEELDVLKEFLQSQREFSYIEYEGRKETRKQLKKSEL